MKVLDPESLALEDDAFVKLVTRYLDDEMEEPEFLAFQEELRGNPDRQELFLQLSSQDVLLTQCGEGMLEQETRTVWRINPARVKMAAIAALAAAAVLVFSLKMSSSETSEAFSGVSVTAVAAAEFAGTSELEPMHAVRLRSGIARFTTEGGAELTAQGATYFEMTGRNELALRSGRLLIDVPEGAEGLRVATPHAAFEDLGTTFGISVLQDRSELYVLNGSVAVLPLDEGREPAAVVNAQEGLAVRHLNGSDGLTRLKFDASGFAAELPEEVELSVRNTGVAGKLGDTDFHWAIIKLPTDIGGNLQRAAVVTNNMYEKNQPGQSQWLSMAHPLPPNPESGKYMFRTIFELRGAETETAYLNGRFWVDNYVSSIRLNGVEQPVPKQDEKGMNHPPGKEQAFSIESGFRAGVNVLEFDVVNRLQDYNRINGSNPLAFRCELSGKARVIHDPKAAFAADPDRQPIR